VEAGADGGPPGIKKLSREADMTRKGLSSGVDETCRNLVEKTSKD
jgi:hypothetical protein